MKKVILLINIIAPYRIPLFNYIAEEKNFDFRVIVLAEKEKNREWQIAKEKIKFNYQILPGWQLFFRTKWREIIIHFNQKVFKTLCDYNPDIIIISGYDSLAYWIAFFYSKLFKKKLVLWNETTLLSTGSVRGLRGLLKKIIIKGADKYIAAGEKSKEYLEYFKANPKDIFIALDTIDVDFFKEEVYRFRSQKDFQKERGKYPKLLLLYVGQLLKRKGIDQVLKALNILKDLEIGFMIVGSGPEEKNLKNFCHLHNLENIFFEGFHQLEELPKYYALADVFILASFQEVWGLVVNEALASGLFVLCSNRVGASYDIINEQNGLIFDPNNVEEIVYYLKKIKAELFQIRTKREAISRWATENLRIEKSAQVFIKVINSF